MVLMSRWSSGGGDPGVVAALGLPEHAVDFFNSSHQFLGFALVDVHLAGAAKLGRFPEGVVEIGERGEVLWLEVVGPKDQEFFLGLLGFVFFDRNEAGEGVVVSGKRCSISCSRCFQSLELFRHGEHRFSVNTRGSGVVDAARSIAMRFHDGSWQSADNGVEGRAQHC